MAKKRTRTPRIDLFFIVAGQSPERCRIPLDVSAHELVMAARGEFLPAGVMPSRLMRGDKPIAFYDPLAPLEDAGVANGDMLYCEVDDGQELEGPSFLAAYRAMTDWAREAVDVGRQLGHLPAADGTEA